MRKLHAFSICLVIIFAVAAMGAYFLMRPSGSRLKDVEVLALIARGSDYSELYDVSQALTGEGASVTTASFTAGEVSGQIHAQISFDDVDVSRYDAIFIPGGSGPKNIIYHPDCQKAFDILVQANDQGKLIAAICHGPWVLAAADLVDGRRVTCYADAKMIDALVNGGADVFTSISVIRDGNIITANGPDAVHDFTHEMIKALTGDVASAKGI